MLFLHGYDASKETFAYQFNYFSNYFKVYAPDLPGFKTLTSSPYDLADYAKCVENFIDETGQEKFFVVAHSFGARIVLKMGDSRFTKIVFTGAAGLKPRRKPTYYFKKWGYRSIKRLFGEVSAEKFGKKFFNNGITEMPEVKRISFIKIVNETLDDRLRLIKVPTLIVWGKNDKETPLYMAKRFTSGIRDSELVVLNGGHFAFIDEYASFNVIVKEFLSR